MPISVFLSRPTPHEEPQREFLSRACDYLKTRGLAPRTIGDTDYGRDPMPHIRSVMMDCNGLLGIGLRRFHVVEGEDRPKEGSEGRAKRRNPSSDEVSSRNRGRVTDRWLTTPYLHMETAIAFQLGLPILLFVQKGVIPEGALESGVLMMYPPTFDLSDGAPQDAFFASELWRQLMNTWEAEVREVVYTKGQPPRLYNR